MKNKKNKFILVFFISIIIIVISTIFGSVKLTSENYNILLSLRIPRVLLSFAIGGMLGLSGSLLQLLLRNPLADGFTTGIASSSALGAVIGISLGLSFYILPFFALIFGLGGLSLVYLIASKSKNFSNITLILAGIVLNIICSALISFLKYYFDESIGAIVFWLMGGVYLFDWYKIGIAFIILFLILIYSYKNYLKLNILSLDEISAFNLGAEPEKMRKIFFIFSALLVSVAVSFAGIIGFVGLIVPHISRGFFGADMKHNILFSTIFGADLLVLSDLISRVIIPSGAELPVGIVTSLIGGSFFLYLLIFAKKKIWY